MSEAVASLDRADLAPGGNDNDMNYGKNHDNDNDIMTTNVDIENDDIVIMAILRRSLHPAHPRPPRHPKHPGHRSQEPPQHGPQQVRCNVKWRPDITFSFSVTEKILPMISKQTSTLMI